MNTNLYDREAYKENYLSLQHPEDKEGCLRLLTSSKNTTLCQGIYDEQFINTAIEQSDCILLRQTMDDPETIVAFALIQLKRKALDILLVCTVPNTERFGVMIAYDTYKFAVKKRCRKIYTSPRTDALRTTFLKYGFQHHVGIVGINEVLMKLVSVQTIPIVRRTRKQY